MLTRLRIENYALIDSLDIDLAEGFSVITGETGAGKSILLGAISLLLGQRAEVKSILREDKRCLVEAEFERTGLEAFFAGADIDYDGTTVIIRREISATGKSRAFVNDTPAPLATLKALPSQLIAIHSQHQNLLLGEQSFQLSALDVMSQSAEEKAAYAEAFAAYTDAAQRLSALRAQQEADQKEQDYLAFQHQQLSDAALRIGELSDLEAEERTLSHAEEITAELSELATTMQADGALLDQLRQAERTLERLSRILPVAEDLCQRLGSTRIEVQDIADELTSHLGTIEADPRRLEAVQERQSLIADLLRKHSCTTERDLLLLQDELHARLSRIKSASEDAAALEAEVSERRTTLLRHAQVLTSRRTFVAKALEARMMERLRQLGMPSATFSVSLTPLPQPTATGADCASLLFAANAGAKQQPISQVASGGEVARVMLALKAELALRSQLPTIIFDEIDTGVSGRVAEAMARMMQGMSAKAQVLSITHLPQIAAMGQTHFVVTKTEVDGRTTSTLRRLSADERVEAIATMLSGSTLTQAALDNARALLG